MMFWNVSACRNRHQPPERTEIPPADGAGDGRGGEKARRRDQTGRVECQAQACRGKGEAEEGAGQSEAEAGALGWRRGTVITKPCSRRGCPKLEDRPRPELFQFDQGDDAADVT